MSNLNDLERHILSIVNDGVVVASDNQSIVRAGYSKSDIEETIDDLDNRGLAKGEDRGGRRRLGGARFVLVKITPQGKKALEED